MHLKVLLPTRVLVDEAVSKVVAEAENGSFGLLPRHVDFVAALAKLGSAAAADRVLALCGQHFRGKRGASLRRAGRRALRIPSHW